MIIFYFLLKLIQSNEVGNPDEVGEDITNCIYEHGRLECIKNGEIWIPDPGWEELEELDPDIPCNITCIFDECEVECATLSTTALPTSPPSIWQQLQELWAKNKKNVVITIVGGGTIYVTFKYIIPYINGLVPTSQPPTEPPTAAPVVMTIDHHTFTYDDCLIGCNQAEFVINNAPSRNFIYYLVGAEGTIDVPTVKYEYSVIQLTVEVDLFQMTDNATLVIHNRDCIWEPCSFDIGIDRVDKACNDPEVIQAFQQSLTSSYVEQYFYDRVKLSFTARPNPDANVSLADAARAISNSCYKSIPNQNLISCKILAANEYTQDMEPSDRTARIANGNRIFQVDLVATFPNKIDDDKKADIQANVTGEVQNYDSMLRDIAQFITVDSDPEAFIVQMVVLCSSIIIGVGGAIGRVVTYRRNPEKQNEEHAVRYLVQKIFFDYLWPILGVYPAVYVWFEYKNDDSLMYQPIPLIVKLLIYFAIVKLIFFFIKVLLMGAEYDEHKWIKKHPITVEIFLEYDIVSYLLCDSFELAVVYFYSSRFMAPENQVSIVNFWIPTFSFLMAFIPGVYHLCVLIRNWARKKKMEKQSKEGVKGQLPEEICNSSISGSIYSDVKKLDKKANKFKFVVAMISEILGIMTLCFTLFLFLCSTAVTLCVRSDRILLDTRLNRQDDNGTLITKSNFFTEEKNAVPQSGICTPLPDKWFNTWSRFDTDCLTFTIEDSDQGARPYANPHPFGACSNPLEIIALATIGISLVLHVIILIIFIVVRYGQKLKRENLKVINKQKMGRKMAYHVTNSQLTTDGVLEHHDSSINGNYSINKLHTFIPPDILKEYL